VGTNKDQFLAAISKGREPTLSDAIEGGLVDRPRPWRDCSPEPTSAPYIYHRTCEAPLQGDAGLGSHPKVSLTSYNARQATS
jgi:hypothetical protein